MIKIKVHSIVDVICNSSTTIYTYHSGCIKPIKELLQEMLGKDADIDKMFYIGVYADSWRLQDVASDEFDIPYNECGAYVQKCIEEDLTGEVEHDWLRIDTDYSGDELYIVAKKPEYNKMAKLLHEVATSTYSEEGYD